MRVDSEYAYVYDESGKLVYKERITLHSPREVSFEMLANVFDFRYPTEHEIEDAGQENYSIVRNNDGYVMVSDTDNDKVEVNISKKRITEFIYDETGLSTIITTNYKLVDRIGHIPIKSEERHYSVSPRGHCIEKVTTSYYYDHVFCNSGTKINPSEQLAKFNNSLTGNNIKLYPNPTSDFLQIEFYTDTDYEKISKIEIVDVLGRVVMFLNDLKEVNNLNLDLRKLSKGLYYIHVDLGHEIITSKFSIQ